MIVSGSSFDATSPKLLREERSLVELAVNDIPYATLRLFQSSSCFPFKDSMARKNA